MGDKELKFATFLLRDVDRDLWETFKSGAEAEGKSARAILVELIQAYVGVVTPAQEAARKRRRKLETKKAG